MPYATGSRCENSITDKLLGLGGGLIVGYINIKTVITRQLKFLAEFITERQRSFGSSGNIAFAGRHEVGMAVRVEYIRSAKVTGVYIKSQVSLIIKLAKKGLPLITMVSPG